MLEDILEAKEVIVQLILEPIEFHKKKFDELAITNKRLIFFKRKGLIFKKDNSSSVGLSKIESVDFKEKGLIRKKGELEIYLKSDNKPIKLEAHRSKIKYIHQKITENL